MNVLVVEPGVLPYEKEIDGLPDMKEIVGGPIEAIYPFSENVAVVCNALASDQSMEFNRSIPERSYGGVFGTFFVCGLGEEGQNLHRAFQASGNTCCHVGRPARCR